MDIADNNTEKKALVFLAARDQKLAELHAQLPGITEALYGDITATSKQAAALASMADDMLRHSPAPVRAYDATIELKVSGDTVAKDLLEAVAGLGDKLAAWIHGDLSALLIGVEKTFIPSEPMPIRYQYLMRRRYDFSHEQYLKRYAEVHSQFGMKTKGIAGYTQFHVDLALSQEAASAAGFGIWQIDSISELHIHSMEEFFQGVGDGKLGAEAIEDERKFLDRPNSVMFNSSTVLRLGPDGPI